MVISLLQIYCSSQNAIICRTQNKGYYVVCGAPSVIKFPCATQELGSRVLEQINLVQNKDLEINKKFYTDATGIKSFKTFSSKYDLITLSWPIKEKILLTPWVRSADGSYKSRDDIPVDEISLHSSNDEIGEALFRVVSNILKLKVSNN